MLKSGAAVVAGVLAALFAAEARAATILVGPGDSIQDAIDGAVAGDTVKILAGRYNQAVTLNKYVKLQGENKLTVILDASGLGVPAVSIDAGLSNALVKNVTIAFSDVEGVAGSDLGPTNVESTILKGCRGKGVYLQGTNTYTAKSNITRSNGNYALEIDGFDVNMLGNKVYRSGGGNVAYGENFVYAKSNASEDTPFGARLTSPLITSESNNSRRGSDKGLECTGADITVNKGSHRSMSERGVLCTSVGGSIAITSVSVKKCRVTAIDCNGANASVTSSKVDLSDFGINVIGSGAAINLCTVKLGKVGIIAAGQDAVVTSNTVKLMRDRGIYVTASPGAFVDSNTVTEVGTSGYGAITVLGSTDGQVSRNVVGDADGGDGIYAEGFGYFRVGGFVGEYQGGNTVTAASRSGIRMTNPANNGSPAYPPVGYYGPRAAFNLVSGCGDLDSAGIQSDGVQSNYIYQNTVTGSAGSGIALGTGTNDATIFGNLIVDSGTNGVLVDGGTVTICTYFVYGSCWSYFSFGPGSNNAVVSNIITNSGSEGVDNGAFSTVIESNTVSFSGIYDFANGGSVNSSPSTGNTPQPSDWNAVPSPAQLDY